MTKLDTAPSASESAIHRLDPRTKILGFLVLVIVAVSTSPRHLAAFAAYAGILLWIAALARASVLRWLLRAACVLPFSLIVALWLPFRSDANMVNVLGLFNASVEGLWLLLAVVMKSFIGAAAAVLLMETTSFPYLALGLRRLLVPSIFTDLLGLSYRYLHVLAEEAGRIRQAAALRGYRSRWLPQAVIVGRMIGNLFLRGYGRAERVYRAMILRGYAGTMPVLQPMRLRLADALAFVALSAALVLFRTLC
ncbi:MAG: cobalt ECF transporter T component CbiQ [Planctomycetota bacterium]|nr:cobalt ECF transporter T component CbiQ [Planctomycetota bacterium]